MAKERERERVIALAHTHTHTHRVIPFLSALILPGPLCMSMGGWDTYSLWFLLEPRAYKAKAIFFPQELVSQFMAGFLFVHQTLKPE